MCKVIISVLLKVKISFVICKLFILGVGGFTRKSYPGVSVNSKTSSFPSFIHREVLKVFKISDSMIFRIFWMAISVSNNASSVTGVLDQKATKSLTLQSISERLTLQVSTFQAQTQTSLDLLQVFVFFIPPNLAHMESL